MTDTSVDIETYSPQDITVTGAFRYAQDPDFEVLLLSYGTHPDRITTIDLMIDDQDSVQDAMANAEEILFDPGIKKHAHNAAFEWWCLSEYYELTWEQRSEWLEQWECTALHMRYCGLPGSLDMAGQALRLGADKAKMREGKALITYFCKPCKPTKANGGRTRNLPEHDPERWAVFKAYNSQDVVAEMELDRLTAAWPVPEELQAQWRDDVRMNARGVGVDIDLTHGALDCAAAISNRLAAEARRITGLANPNSPAQLRAWLAQQGEETISLTKDTVSELLANPQLPAGPRRVLELRQMLAKTSNKKYDAIVDAAGPDDRIRGTLQFYGASRTGRWAGRLLQVQNLPRTHLKHQDEIRQIIKYHDVDSIEAIYGDVNDVLSQMIRTALVPQDGKWFIDADFSAIEARLIAWEAGENWVLDVFRTTGKIYEATAARIFGVPFDTIIKGNPNYEYRQKGKVATLALGYQGGVGAMKRMGGDQLGLDDGGLQDIVDRWRAQNPAIRGLWGRMQMAAVRAIRTGRPAAVTRKVYAPANAAGNESLTGGSGYSPYFNSEDKRPICIFRLERSTAAPFPFLTMELPSGRKLFYANPSTTEDDRILYWEQNTPGWTESETYGGKLTENLTQACGRDCLEFALKNLAAAGYEVVFHVHDEVIVEIATQEPAAELQKIIGIMSQVPPWAAGLPLNADGWYGQFYTKD